MEAADGVLGVDAAVGPGQASVALDLDQREAVAIGTGEMQALLAEGFVSLQAVDVVRGEPFRPERQRALGHGENGFADLARARAPASDIREREIGHHRAGRSDLVAIVEMIDVGSVEIHRLFHSAQAQRLGEERIVGLGCPRPTR